MTSSSRLASSFCLLASRPWSAWLRAQLGSLEIILAACFVGLRRRRPRLGAAGILLRATTPAAAEHGADIDFHVDLFSLGITALVGEFDGRSGSSSTC